MEKEVEVNEQKLKLRSDMKYLLSFQYGFPQNFLQNMRINKGKNKEI
jgi:hypothetical protein